jgi:hypothetical protein
VKDAKICEISMRRPSALELALVLTPVAYVGARNMTEKLRGDPKGNGTGTNSAENEGIPPGHSSANVAAAIEAAIEAP